MYKVIGIDQKEYGPVSAEQLRDWIAQGRVNGQTKLRLDGTETWKALSDFPEFAPDLAAKTPPPPPPPPPGTQASAPQGSSAADALAQQILTRDYEVRIGHCIGRGWDLVRNDFWVVIGISAVISIIIAVTNSISIGLFLNGPLLGGLFYFYLKRIRGTKSTINDAFAGFTSSFIQLLLASLVSTVLLVVAFFCCILPGIYLAIAWKFTFILIIDKNFEFWSAMELSRKVITHHWWQFLGLAIMLFLLNLLGSLVLCVGAFITAPITVAALAYAYEDVFGSRPPAAA
jgi:hypothetical protein